MTSTRLFLILALLIIRIVSYAQAPAIASSPLIYHPVRSISPADTNFRDLAFLKKEIGDARVVFLGEPTHGEGNVFEAKTRLVRYLQQQGFGTIAFESGFYEVARAQQAIEAGQDPAACLSKSVFPIWTQSREFQSLISLVGTSRLKIAGFDPQLSGEYGEELVEDLQAFLGSSKQVQDVPFDYLEEVVASMGHFYTFPPTHQYALFNMAIGKVSKQVRQVAAADPRRRARAEFWLQTLTSLNALARDYAQNDTGAKGPQEFKAQDSNLRDRLMADNLLWYLRQHPTEKVICWGAAPHFAGRLTSLQNPELQAFRPMGGLVKASLPMGQVYLLGTATAGGKYGNVHRPHQEVPVPAPGGLEAQLAALGPEYLFVPMRQPTLESTTASLFEYQPVAGNWTQVFDGLLFLRTVRPPVLVGQPLPLTRGDSVRFTKTGRGTLAMDARRVRMRAAGTGLAGGRLCGVVLDQKTQTAVPFASVYLKQQEIGLITNIKGEFELPQPTTPDSLVVTSLGFGRQAVAVPAQPYLTVLLPPYTYSLAEVTIKGESMDARTIMARVLQRLPQNYTQQDYNANVYARASSTNFDSLLYDVDYFSSFYDPQGYRSVGEATSRLEEVKWNKEPGKGNVWTEYHFAHSGYFTNFHDLVDKNPLFQARTLKSYTYSLSGVIQEQGRDLLVIDFAARKNSYRTTGDYFDQGYSGKLYVNRADYAVTRCEVEWQRDTVLLNSLTHKYYAQGGSAAQRWHHVHQDYRIRQTVTYQQLNPGGPYFLDHSAQTWIEKHTDLATGRRMEKLSVLSLQFANIRTSDVVPLAPQPSLASMLLKGRPFNEAFWRTHLRPDSLRGQTK
ncbi:hypothetical protein FY528_04960 [Hymenobacter lutimineralis]|uniref:Erythromycin esterase family protein n=1 Tax=Hymenobacter lutimineralis TaxID=2606448 RepID=A0A5D6VBH3_9BACT|nr:erythromycin esterase family protein [Hymenobacter lutimineralis]TYZ12647.1 hypothetical protein FY528_04960 [Hymenobacter lutimineralis]